MSGRCQYTLPAGNLAFFREEVALKAEAPPTAIHVAGKVVFHSLSRSEACRFQHSREFGVGKYGVRRASVPITYAPETADTEPSPVTGLNHRQIKSGSVETGRYVRIGISCDWSTCKTPTLSPKICLSSASSIGRWNEIYILLRHQSPWWV
jgi:hypothetical protein